MHDDPSRVSAGRGGNPYSSTDLPQANATVLANSHKARQVASRILLALAVTCLGGFAACMLFVLPALARELAEYEVELPLLTVRLLQTPSWLVVALVAVWGIGLLAKERLAFPNSLKIALNSLSLLAAMGLLLGFALGLYLPLAKLIQGLQ